MSNKPLFRFLDTVGDGSGVKNAIGDYSSTPTKFLIKSKPGEMFFINRLLVSIEDDKTCDAEVYGSMASALTNGVEIKETANDALVVDITDGLPIKTNGEWGRICSSLEVKDWGPTAAYDYIQVCVTFGKCGQPLFIDGDSKEQLEIILNDDFSGLVAHHFMVQGYIKAI